MIEIQPEQYTILIVDDIIDNLIFLTDLLEIVGYNTTFAKNGQAALESVQRFKPDLILLDIMMPVMDGLECCKILKSDPNYQDIPILFLTASDKEEDLSKAFELGGSDYITKPFSKNELLNRVKHQLTIHKQAQEIKEKQLLLEIANRKLENFNRMVCHDLINPVNNIKSFSYLLEEKLKYRKDPKLLQYLEYIDNSANKIITIINSLVVLTNINKTETRYFNQVNLSNLVEKILSELQQQQPERQSEFIVQPDLLVTGDKNLLIIALQNLLDNAWKYSSKKAKTTIQLGTMTKQDLIKNKIHIPSDIRQDLDKKKQSILFKIMEQDLKKRSEIKFLKFFIDSMDKMNLTVQELV